MKSVIKETRFLIRLLSAFWQKQKKLIIISGLVGIVSFFCFPKIIRWLVISKTQRIGIVGRFTTTDLPLEIQNLLSDGLTCLAEDGSVSPCLAASWEIGNEGKEYIFTLKDNIFWQDGKPVKTAEINYNFSDVAIEVIDDKKIKFILKEPFSPFPVIVSRPIFKKGLLGTGRYKVKSIKKNGQIIEKLNLTPNLTFRFYPTETAARTAFKLGEVDVLKQISSPGELETWKGIKITSEVKNNRFVAIFINTQNQKFALKSVRQALAYAIKDRWEPKALNPLNPNSWAYNSAVKPYKFDLENAKKLLKKSVTEEEGQSLTEVELATVPSLMTVADSIKDDWEQLGIKTKIKIISSLDEEFETLLISQDIPPDPDQYNFWHSTQITNISHYKSPKIDKLLEDGRKTQDQEKRKAIYFDFQKFLVEETPAIFLFHPTVYTISRI
jgi:peptide/nickel transport system substrate-binding protein